MKIVGIIAEFNPFHNGHKYLIKKAKETTNADIVICIISGNFTQLGNISIIDKFKRAKIAIENGADAIIELPTIYATASSQYFAFGAVNILNSLNCIDYLCFGSETANIEELKNIANKLIANEKEIWKIIQEELKNGISFASARQNAISDFLSAQELAISSLSNNILAIEYIKSLIKLKSNITPIAIKRKKQENITSATNIRQMLYENNNDVYNYLPYKETSFDKALFNDNFYKIVQYNIISRGKEYIKNINEVTEGLENKIYNAINVSANYEEFIHNIKSKRYQLSKIKRILIYILLDISKEDFLELNNNSNIYIHLLAINNNIKNSLLSLINKKAKCKIFTSINDKLLNSQSEIVKKSLLLDIKATNIYSILSDQNINKDYTNKL